MWTPKDIAEVALLLALIASAPFVYAFFSKLTTYLLNRHLPRDTVVEIKAGGQCTRRYLVKRKLLRSAEIYELSACQDSRKEMHI